MELSEAFEALEGWESESESAEARRPVRRPSSAPSFRPRPAPGTPAGVTQAQLEAALARVDGKIKTVADGVSTIQARATALTAASKKEADERKKSVDTQSKDLNQKLQLMALLPMLVTPSSAGPVTDNNGVVIDKVLTPESNILTSLLPLLVVTGLGGAGGVSLGGEGVSDGGSNMLLLALVLAMGKK
jgi:hypothetical protein